MDMMQLRRRLMAQMAGARVVSGTFIGDGSATATINIGFEPDVVVIESGHYWNEAGFTGMLDIVLCKNVIIINVCHLNDTQVTSPMYGTPIAPGQDAWGADYTASYTSYATYSDGIMTILNRTPNGAQSKFKNNNQYTWTAYKK